MSHRFLIMTLNELKIKRTILHNIVISNYTNCEDNERMDE